MSDEISKNFETQKLKILEFISDNQYTPMRAKDIMYILGILAADADRFNDIISELIKNGKIVLTKKGKIMSPESMGLIYGVFIGNSRGFGFVSPISQSDAVSDYSADIFIPPTGINGALHKDKVMCRITDTSGKRPEGEILSIVEKGVHFIIGTFSLLKEGRLKGSGFVTPDDKRMGESIFIRRENSKGAVSDHKVAVKIIRSGPFGEDQELEGVITDILGHKNDPGVDVLSVILKHELRTEFPRKVYRELDALPGITPHDIENRKDFRSALMVTIDDEDAKDLDDAVSLEISDSGNFMLGVHIADVCHYVREGSETDKEAFKRGTSVYLADRVLPMLPHKLSNDICSLNPNTDRLALSCVMEIGRDGKTLSHEIYESVININKRMTYTEVNSILTDEKNLNMNSDDELITMLINMGRLSDVLREKRIRRGALEFGFAESKIIVDESGWPTEIRPRLRNAATSLIEEFMLVCNETIAEQYFWMESPFVYRTHEDPDPEKTMKLLEFVSKFGLRVKGHGFTKHPKAIQNLLASVSNRPEEAVISGFILRSLKQARYTAQNFGHFGLAAKYYCHFTSPIRRYPDLQIHRIIKHNLSYKLTDDDWMRSLSKNLPEICRACSTNERVAEQAEREVDNIKKAQYMSNKLGEEFSGVVSWVNSRGLFVELPNTVEGMVHVSDMDDDFYFYDEKNICLIGEDDGKIYSIGDKLNVILIKTDLTEGKIYWKISDI